MLDESIKDDLQDLDVTVMFCAGPKDLVQFLDKKKANIFYNIFCFYVEETDHYVVFTKIFKPTKRKQKNGSYVSLLSTDNKVFQSKEQTYDFLNTFLDNIVEHDRFINEEILQENQLNATEAITSIMKWETSMLAYFNDTIEDGIRKNKRTLLRLF